MVHNIPSSRNQQGLTCALLTCANQSKYSTDVHSTARWHLKVAELIFWEISYLEMIVQFG